MNLCDNGKLQFLGNGENKREKGMCKKRRELQRQRQRQTTQTATSVTVNAIACGRMAKDAVERMRNSMGMNKGIAKEQDKSRSIRRRKRGRGRGRASARGQTRVRFAACD